MSSRRSTASSGVSRMQVEVLHLVEHAERPALLAGAVVRQQDEDGVVQLPKSLQRRRPGDRSGASVWSRKPAKASCSRQARRRWFSGSVSHGSTPGLRGASAVPGGTHAQLELAGEPVLAGGVPAVVELAPVLGEVLGRCLVRGVGGPEGEVDEEGPVRADGRRVVDELDRLVDQVLAEVVALLGRAPAGRPGGCRTSARA